MESLLNRVREANRVLRGDIQDYFDLKLSPDNKRQGLIEFLAQIEFLTQEDRTKIVSDMDSYAL